MASCERHSMRRSFAEMGPQGAGHRAWPSPAAGRVFGQVGGLARRHVQRLGGAQIIVGRKNKLRSARAGRDADPLEENRRLINENRDRAFLPRRRSRRREYSP